MKYIYDTQLLIEGVDLEPERIIEYFNDNFDGDSMLIVGDDRMVKVHYHTNEPWLVLEYCSSLGEIYDIVVENMARQAIGLKG
ncbi:MAG TPA: kinase to dihydroxyacetone kinase [Clostridiales bacterium]|nr:kinase to dihydroxyacetone kinase [Clostridiales bacterium]